MGFTVTSVIIYVVCALSVVLTALTSRKGEVIAKAPRKLFSALITLVIYVPYEIVVCTVSYPMVLLTRVAARIDDYCRYSSLSVEMSELQKLGWNGTDIIRIIRHCNYDRALLTNYINKEKATKQP